MAQFCIQRPKYFYMNTNNKKEMNHALNSRSRAKIYNIPKRKKEIKTHD